jgi:hypothetical protein
LAARALRATVFLGSFQTGALRAPPPTAASLFLIQLPKIIKNYQIRATRVKGFPETKCFP